MAHIVAHSTVARDGYHNAFTDLQHWQGMYWVSYRKGSGHVSMDGEAVAAVSTDRTRFREVASVKLYGDNRDPKLFPISPDRMAMTIPNWEGEYAGWALQQYIAFSGDGFNWEKPVPILKKGQWLWRIREHDGVYYGLGQEIETDRETRRHRHALALMKSSDLLEWEMHCRVGTPEMHLNESDILWRADGEAWIVARSTNDPGYSYFCSSQPPYTAWQCKTVKALIHAPVMLEHAGVVYVAGRSKPELEGIDGFPTRCSLGVWRIEEGDVQPVLRIPAMGDCSYPGLIKDPDGRICMSYYSQHAYHMGVEPMAWQQTEPGKAQSLVPSDVFFAELALP